MRSIALLTVFILMPGTAMAGSITTVSTMVDPDGSIMTIGCPSCNDEAAKPQTPALLPGQEIVRLEQVDGKTKVYRTSNWFGGSPVTFVRNASKAELAALERRGIDVASTSAQPLAPEKTVTPNVAGRDGIDRKAKTGSLGAVHADMARFDPDGFRLRLNVSEAAD